LRYYRGNAGCKHKTRSSAIAEGPRDALYMSVEILPTAAQMHEKIPSEKTRKR